MPRDVQHDQRIHAVLASLVLALGYVGSLYIARGESQRNRDHPMEIKARIKRVVAVSLVAPIMLMLFFNPKEIPAVMGWRPKGFPFLTVVFFYLGDVMYGGLPGFKHLDKLILLRNLVVGPITEEIVFRGCITSILVQGGWGTWKSSFIGPAMFGIAHFHHLWDNIVHKKMPKKQAVLLASLQFSYTTLFGVIVSWIFIKTRSLFDVILIHAFCNVMGLPQIPETASQGAIYAVGYILFIALMHYLSGIPDPLET